MSKEGEDVAAQNNYAFHEISRYLCSLCKGIAQLLTWEGGGVHRTAQPVQTYQNVHWLEGGALGLGLSR